MNAGLPLSPAFRQSRGAPLAALLLAGVLFSGIGIEGAYAAPPSDDAAASLRQHLDQFQQFDKETQEPKQQGDVVVTAPATRAGLPAPGGPTVLLKSVTFAPASVFLSQAELDAITSRYIGRREDFAGISSLVRDVNDLYAKKGIVTASAILPPQKLSDGNLKVQLVEGELGKVIISGPHNTSDKYILDRVRLDTKGVVDVPKAARDITFFNKTNQAQLRLLLQPGATFGLTDLSLGITEPPRTSLQVFMDNQGTPSTGEIESGAFFRGYDLLGFDDNLTIYATGSRGSLAGTVSYDVPFTTSGTRVAASYTRSRIAVIGGPTAALDITGNSQAASVTLSQPLVGTTDWTVLASLSGVYGTSTSDSGVVPLVDSETIKGAAGLSITYTGEGKTFSLNPQVIYAKANDLLGGTSADIWLAAGNASAALSLSKEFSLAANGAFQVSNTQLLPGDLLFQIGGANTVRGYQADAVAGDSGYFTQVELHRELSQLVEGLDGFVFGDFGEVFSTFPARTTLGSLGAGFSWAIEPHATAELSAGFPVINALPDQPVATVYARLVAHLL